MVPRTVNQCLPGYLIHSQIKAVVAFRIAVYVGEKCLIVEGGAGRHPGDNPSKFIHGLPTISLRPGDKPGGLERAASICQSDRIPILRSGVEGTPDVQCIGRKLIQDILIHLYYLLHHVIDFRLAVINPQGFAQIVVGHGGNAGTGSGPDIQGKTIRLAVIDGGQYAFSACHTDSLFSLRNLFFFLG